MSKKRKAAKTSLGATVAKAMRARANKLTPEQRHSSMVAAFQLIYKTSATEE